MWLFAGLHIFLLKIARGEPAEISDVFSGGPYLWRMLGNTVVFGAIVTIGLCFCLAPGVILASMLWPFAYVLVDTDPPGLDALSRATDITKNNIGAGLLLALASFGISILGASACVVGLFFTTPFVLLLFAVAYCDMTGQPTAPVLRP